MLIGLTHGVSPNLHNCEITFIDREPINYPVAVEQHDRYCATLRKCGVAVKKLSANLSYPDSCFVEDTAVVLDELAIITSMGVASRRGETAAVESELAKYRDLTRILSPATLEGGDVLRVGRRLFVGLSGRTNPRGIEEFTRILKPRGYDVCPVNVKDSLHLKTACTALSEETLLVSPKWVDLAQFKGYKLLSTPDEESRGANTLRVRDTILLQAGFPRTIELVQRFFGKIELVEISEFRKAEAALSCLSIIFQVPDI